MMTHLLSSSLKLTSIAVLLAIFVATTFAQPPGKRSPGKRKRPRQRKPDNLKVGDVAPGFTLKSPDGKTTVMLSDYKGKKPVALVFGSYT